MKVSTSGPNDDAFQQLHHYGVYIDEKFRTGRAHDVSPDTVQNILHLLTKLPKKTKHGMIGKRIRELEGICSATLMYYRDGRSAEEYFLRLRLIPDLIKQLHQLTGSRET